MAGHPEPNFFLRKRSFIVLRIRLEWFECKTVRIKEHRAAFIQRLYIAPNLTRIFLEINFFKLT